MAEALAESIQNIGLTHPNPSVGCILVDASGKEISRGCTQPFPGDHAEKIAFDQVRDASRLKGGTAYITLEPCSHFGKNPPCVDLLTQSPLQKVVIARKDPNKLVNGQGIEKLKAAGKQVVLGTLSPELTAWNLGFIGQQILNRPLVVLKWAQTLDGQLADDSHTSQWISGQASRSYAHWLRQRYDLTVIGAQTLLQDLPQLTVRDCNRPHQKDPLPIIFDPKGITLHLSKQEQRTLRQQTFSPGRKWIIITTQSAQASHRQSWINQEENIILLEQRGQDLIPEFIELLQGPEVSQTLGRPVQSILVEGGSKTLTLFLAARLCDVLHTFISPLITGGAHHRITPTQLLNQAERFELVSSSRLGPDLVMEMISKELRSKAFY
jgi:diaminohydroxyphosphoribosylaminopyrimidine deaminase/5-amino-6-(5-phosphoribosylamino)uracil reductase